MMFFKKEKLPVNARLDLCSMCNLNCRDCYMRKYNSCAIGSGYVTLENFISFLDKNPFIKILEISNNGEVFLNPHLLDMLKIAYERGVQIYCNSVNFNKVSDEVLEGFVKYNVRMLTVAIDGACQETYVKYRRGGNFDNVINNIKKLNEYKKKYKKIYPELLWQYIVMDTNDSEEEILKAKEIAKSLDCEIFFKKTWNPDYKPSNPVMIEKLTGLDFGNDDLAFSDFSKKWGVGHPCISVWNWPQVNWDGRLMLCCCNYFKNIDINVFEIGLEKALQHPIVKKTKKMLMGGKACKDSPCYNCWVYKNIVKEKSFIKKKEVEF